MTRTVGVEEEMFLVDPSTRRLTAVSERVICHSDADDSDDATLEHELFLQQVETQTHPHRDLDDLLAELRSERHAGAEAAAKAGAVIVATGTPVLADVDGSITPDSRYAKMIAQHGLVGHGALACATHVHVEVDDDEAIAVIDSLARWLPLLVALSSNSPINRGVDTGFASWRAQLWDAWPTAGPVEPFGDRAGYDRSVRTLIDSGAALDEAMIYFDVRVARDFPTVEVRVADICTDIRDTVVIAALARALVETAAMAVNPGQPWRVEMLRAARWRARRYGLTDALMHPLDGQLVPASDALSAMLTHVSDALDADDSKVLVEEGVARLLREGSGAERQRRVLADYDIEAVVDDLIDRTLV
jgi:carboxylate-amine ligase